MKDFVSGNLRTTLAAVVRLKCTYYLTVWSSLKIFKVQELTSTGVSDTLFAVINIWEIMIQNLQLLLFVLFPKRPMKEA